MRRGVCSAAVAVVVLGLALPAAAVPAAPAPPAHVGLSIQLLDGPASLEKDPRAHAYVIDHVAPGATFTRHVAVLNDTGQPQHVLLYPDAARIAGGSFVPAAGHGVNDLTQWISVSPQEVDLQQGQRVTAAVTFAVAADASKGEHYGAVFAEIPARSGSGLSLASRVGIRVYLDVGFGAAPPSDFSITTLTAERAPDGSPVVKASIKNTGGRALDMSGQLWLRNGPGGLSAGPFPAQLGTTLGIGQEEPVTVTLDKQLPAGPWLAHLEMQSGLVKHAAEATITFPARPGAVGKAVPAKAVPLTKDKTFLGIVAGSIILLVALGIALVLFLLWRRRRRGDGEPSTGEGDPPPVPRPRDRPRDRERSRR